MKKEPTRLTNEQKAELAALAELPDDQIDTTDILEITDWSGGRRGLSIVRAAKQQSSLELDGDLLNLPTHH